MRYLAYRADLAVRDCGAAIAAVDIHAPTQLTLPSLQSRRWDDESLTLLHLPEADEMF